MGRALVALTLSLAGCQLADVYIFPDGGSASGLGSGRVDAGRTDAGGGGRRLANGTDVLTLLEGHTLLMDAAHVPTHPNGYDENLNFGSATQCIHAVRMDVLGGGITVSTELATLEDAPNSGDRGRCDRATPKGDDVTFSTTAVLVENVREGGGCFDITLTYAGFGQEGRGKISDDQRTVSLELFFRDQATGHRCASGEVGSRSVTLNQEAFTGDAVQVYSLSN